MVAAKKHVPIVKKRTAQFKRHQSDRFKCVGESWRKPKGIDNAVRRRFRGQAVMPKVRFEPRKDTGAMLRQDWKEEEISRGRDDIAGQLHVFGTNWLISNLFTDWLRFQQEDPPHDAFRPQGVPCQQHP